MDSKNIFRATGLLTVFVFQLLFAQEDTTDFTCNFQDNWQRQIEENVQLGGLHITSFGTVRALMVFIDFSDDNEDPTNPVWPVGQGPNYLNNIIDPVSGQSSGTNNITAFFDDVGFNQFHLIGEAKYRQARYTLDYYKNDPTYRFDVPYWATRHVLEDLDVEMDYSIYDNWTKVGNYTHDNQPDGKVDMVIVVYRDKYIASGFVAYGWAGLNHSWTNSYIDVDDGQRKIYFGYYGSGVTACYMYQSHVFQTSLHEFSHYWGLPHNYNLGMWTVMSYWQKNVSPFMNSYERERLGWMTFTDITVDGTNATIADFGTAAVAYRVQINANESYLVENHQAISQFDDVNKYDNNLNSFDAPGLYILQLNNIPIKNKIHVACADGLWNWDNPYWTQSPWSENPYLIPVYDRLDANNQSGLSDKEMIPHTNGDVEKINAWLDDKTNSEKFGARYKGLGNSRWTPEKYNMLSQWSNPPANESNGTPTTIGIEVWDQSGSNINVKFYTTNPEDGPPSIPQNFAVSWSADDHPYLTWDYNTEPDVYPNGNYEIWKKSGGSWSLKATTSDNFYEDITETRYTGGRNKTYLHNI